MDSRSVIWLALVLLGVGGVGCAPDCTPVAGPLRLNVVLLTIDTFRADHLGCYGNSMVRTPALDRLAAEGALFERFYAQTHVTVPSHLTILSSLPLAEHGVLSNLGKLERAVEAFPQVFARAGYHTGAVVSAKHLGPEFALGGALTTLELYDAPRRVSVPSLAEETNGRLFRWMRGVCRHPFFVWVHYWDPHMPYSPPPPFDRAYYKGNPYDPRHASMDEVTLAWHFYDLRGIRRLLAPHAEEVEALQRKLHLSWRELRNLILYPVDVGACVADPVEEEDLRRRLTALASFLRPRLTLRPNFADWLRDVRDLRFARAQYAGEISYVDQAVGRLRAELEALGIADRTILVVTADHGESLGEHGIYFDHATLYEQDLRVPLIIWAPGRVQPGQKSELARGLDVAPTVLTLAGLPVPPEMQGRDLFDASAFTEAVVAESSRGRQIMIYDGRWKLIRTLATFDGGNSFARKAGATEIYDLRNDPGEEENLSEARRDILQVLGGRLDAWLAAQGQSRDGGGVRPEVGTLTPLSRERLEGLRALGYLE